MGWKNPNIPDCDWNEPEARALVSTVVAKYGGMFDACRDRDEEDLISDALIHVRKHWHKFNPDKGKHGSFICYVAWRYLITMNRGLTTRLRVESGGSIYRDSDSPRALPRQFEDTTAGEMDVLEMTEAFYKQSLAVVAQRGIPARQKHGGGRFESPYTLPQAMTLLVLHQRLKLSYRGMAHVLRNRPDVRRAMRLRRTPHYSTLSRVFRRVARLREFRRRTPKPSLAAA